MSRSSKKTPFVAPELMKRIEAMNERHSVRQYLDKPLDADTISALQEEINTCNKKGNLKYLLGRFDIQ